MLTLSMPEYITDLTDTYAEFLPEKMPSSPWKPKMFMGIILPYCTRCVRHRGTYQRGDRGHVHDRHRVVRYMVLVPYRYITGTTRYM